MTAVLEPQTPDRVTDLVELYKGRRSVLLRRAAKYSGRPGLAEDIVQDAFEKLVAGYDQLQERGVAPGAFLNRRVQFDAAEEVRTRIRRGEEVPVGDAMGWQPDTAPPAEDLDTLPVCMGDPATVKAVDAALAKLPERHATAIRLRMLTTPPVKVSEIAERLGVNGRTVYDYLNEGLAALSEMHVELPEEEPEPAPAAARRKSPAGIPTVEELTATLDREHPGEWLGPAPAHETLRRVHGTCSAKRAGIAQQAHNKPLTPPMRIRAGLGPESLAAANAELVETLGREFPGRTVSIKDAEETLRRIHTTCALGRVRQARVEHNAKVSSASVPSGTVAGPASGGVPAINGSRPPASVTKVVAPAPTASRGPVVAEVWLLGNRPPISCMLVHTDETTGSRDLAAVSLMGAQREITGQLIGDGYRPDGPWIDVDPAAPEAMRKFQVAQ